MEGKSMTHDEKIIACSSCDRLHHYPDLLPGHLARCRSCDGALVKRIGNLAERTFALTLAALVLFMLANAFPFLAFETRGIHQEITLASSVFTLVKNGMPWLALVVAGSMLIAPLFAITGLLYIASSLRFGRVPPLAKGIGRWLHHVRPWVMSEVFLVGVIVSLVKVAGMAEIVLGISFWAFVGLILVVAAASAGVERREFWQAIHNKPPHVLPSSATSRDRAIAAGLASCHICGALVDHDRETCPRCEGTVHLRKPASLQKTWALLIAAAILYIPANIYPIMQVQSLGKSSPSTIMSGVLTLWHHGSYPIAAVIFIASVLVPLGKLFSLSYLALSVQLRKRENLARRTKLYRITELIGRWSMIDVFVVAVLAALVQAGTLMSIEPGGAAIAFAGVVILTIVAAETFDPRLMWDVVDDSDKPSTGSQ